MPATVHGPDGRFVSWRTLVRDEGVYIDSNGTRWLRDGDDWVIGSSRWGYDEYTTYVDRADAFYTDPYGWGWETCSECGAWLNADDGEAYNTDYETFCERHYLQWERENREYEDDYYDDDDGCYVEAQRTRCERCEIGRAHV